MNKYDLMAISTETAGKLLQGEFKTFDEFYKSVDFSQGDKDIYILYREFRNENRIFI